jgi:hypothetical protein
MRVFLTGWLVFFLALGLIANTAAHAKPAAKQPDPPAVVWPQEPCNLAHRMDIAIVDGMFFECQCMRLLVGYQCDWYLVAGVSSAKLSRKIKHPAKKRVSIRVAHPAVVA